MDNKKKLEDAYIPDNHGRREKVLIGLSGGLDSFVTAYLLKIQKYDLLAVTIINSLDDFNSENLLSCHINNAKLESIKEFCNRVNIPLQIVKASQEFRESVFEKWVGDRILGKKSYPCWDCHELRMNILHEKMREAGAKKMATGHFAKLFHQEGKDSVFVHTSNDEIYDQSALLSRVSKEILSSLILPLSDLTKKEVVKLGENFGLVGQGRVVKFLECLIWNNEMATYFEKKIPKRLFKEGEITTVDASYNLGQHEGVYPFTLGENFEIKDGVKYIKGIFGFYVPSERRMGVVEPGFFLRNKILLTSCRFSEGVSWMEPVKGYLVLQGGNTVECWIHPKTISSVHLELSQSEKFIGGEVLSVLKKKGKNSKVFVTGEVRLLPVEEVQEEGEQNVQKVNPTLDF